MRWADVIENPLLQNLPFKIELNRWGRIEGSPACNQRGAVQSDLVAELRRRRGGRSGVAQPEPRLSCGPAPGGQPAPRGRRRRAGLRSKGLRPAGDARAGGRLHAARRPRSWLYRLDSLGCGLDAR